MLEYETRFQAFQTGIFRPGRRGVEVKLLVIMIARFLDRASLEVVKDHEQADGEMIRVAMVQGLGINYH